MARGALTLAVFAGSSLALAALWWLARPGPAAGGGGPAPVTVRVPAAAPALPEGDPFARALAVLGQGGGRPDVEETIGVFDTAAREGAVLSAGSRSELVRTLARGTPPGMSTGTWAHLFNSACNALAAGGARPDPGYLDLLLRLAAGDRRHEIRLYALQHLGARYPSCDEGDKIRIRALVDGILAEQPVSPVAGTALVLASRWHGDRIGRPGGGILPTALALAADPGLPADIRVTALYTAGEDASVLATTRTLAGDASQPVILRKAALWLLGRHGAEADLALLRRCAAEGMRLAQAADPASAVLRDRLAGVPEPVRTPF